MSLFNFKKRHLRKKIFSSKRSVIMARFLVDRETKNGTDTLVVRPATHIKTGNLTGQGHKYVSRFIVVVHAKSHISDADLDDNKYYFTGTANNIKYGLILEDTNQFKTNQKSVKNLFTRLNNKKKKKFF